MIERPIIKFFKLPKADNAKIPNYAHEDDAGFDLYSPTNELIKSHAIVKIPLGLISEIPVGWYVQFFDKGSTSSKGIHVIAGVVDAGYRGEWNVLLVNLGEEDYSIETGDKIAQGILLQVPQAKIVEVFDINELTKTMRGSGAFGSTGKK